MIDIWKLDNPVWHALNETHAHLCVSFPNLRFYNSDYCTFGAISDSNEPYHGLEEYAASTDDFYIVGVKPVLKAPVAVLKEVVCDQMICTHEVASEYSLEKEILKLTPDHYEALFNLVNLVQPGYFQRKTPEMGTFYGIFESGQLVAAAGCRIQMDAFVEISSVVTHPQYVRRNYAFHLTLRCIEDIKNRGKIPYLHVLETNEGAIALYKKAGFVFKRKMSFWKVKKSKVAQ